jgi:capsular polysaccharide biosynthesis protein
MLFVQYDNSHFVSMFADIGGSVEGRTEQEFLLNPEETLFLPPSLPLHSDSSEHELQVFWAFESGRFLTTRPVKMYCLRDVVVTTEGIAFTSDGKCLLETMYPFTPDACYQRFPQVAALWGNEGRFSALKAAASEVDEAIFLREPGESGYFHWINSVLPRVAVLDRFPMLSRLPLLVSSSKKFSRQSLELLGINLDRVFKSDSAVFVKRLWISTPCIFRGDHFTRPAFWTRELRRVLQVEDREPGSKLAYLSRSDASVRRVVNEGAVVDAFRKRGAEVIAFEGMNFQEQISVVQDVKHFFSLHGAGLSNTLFMPSGGVFEIVSRTRLWPTFRTSAGRANLKYGAFITQAQPKEAGVDDGNEDVVVDIDKMSDFVDEVLTRHR